ncbi:hypothetical protein [Bifidobacterium castoris]|uniref:Uncharacterized protein n=1 Tax=Bifidobacterium castoris TaxID=2306972 RepID=A0A430FAF2_9BIFI|nr:hypothetical protein [Bifidobacterium castoris]RSX49803.1 hypothetical protein D2E22_0264 [Bifidobacterium castoris]
MNTTNTPTLNNEHADFRLDPDALAYHPDTRAYMSRSDLENDVRGALDPDAWNSEDTYETTVEAVTDHFSHWIDYAAGTWEGTDIIGNLDTVNPDDFWTIVARLDTDRTPRKE